MTGQEKEIDYKAIFSNMNNGFAFHEIVVDGQGRPINYRFLEVNPSFEEIIGLKRKDIVGKLVTEVIPGIEDDPADWIGKYGNVALNGKPVKFESYSEALKKWFRISAYSLEKGFFITIFDDVTTCKKAEIELTEKNNKLEELLKDVIAREEKMIEMKRSLRQPDKLKDILP